MQSELFRRLSILVESLKQEWLGDDAAQSQMSRFDSTLGELKTQLGRAIAENHLLEKQLAEVGVKVKALERRAEAAIRDGHEEDARAMIREKVAATRQSQRKLEEQAALTALIDRLDGLLNDVSELADSRLREDRLLEIEDLLSSLAKSETEQL